MHLRTALL